MKCVNTQATQTVGSDVQQLRWPYGCDLLRKTMSFGAWCQQTLHIKCACPVFCIQHCESHKAVAHESTEFNVRMTAIHAILWHANWAFSEET